MWSLGLASPTTKPMHRSAMLNGEEKRQRRLMAAVTTYFAICENKGCLKQETKGLPKVFELGYFSNPWNLPLLRKVMFEHMISQRVDMWNQLISMEVQGPRVFPLAIHRKSLISIYFHRPVRDHCELTHSPRRVLCSSALDLATWWKAWCLTTLMVAVED